MSPTSTSEQPQATAIRLGDRSQSTKHCRPNVLGQNEILSIVHAAAVKLSVQSGYGNIVHVFLPRGIDTCFDLTTICYSPDNPPSFYFCAYHGSVVFSDIGHILFSVEPYQNVPGCQVATPTPNGDLVDS